MKLLSKTIAATLIAGASVLSAQSANAFFMTPDGSSNFGPWNMSEFGMSNRGGGGGPGGWGGGGNGWGGNSYRGGGYGMPGGGYGMPPYGGGAYGGGFPFYGYGAPQYYPQAPAPASK